MRTSKTTLICCLAGASSVLGALPLNLKQSPPTTAIPTRFIIELENTPDASGKRASGSIHARIYESLRQRDVPFTVDKEFDAEGLFIGAAVTLSNPNDMGTLARTPGVATIRPNMVISRPKPVERTVLGGNAAASDNQSTHKMTGVDKLHAEGLLGQGIKIGIIDTGTDYTHPALGGGFGAGYKVAGGYDFVGDNYNGGGAVPVPDDDPLDQCAGHGTHVAGIIGADPTNPYNISGVAYKSTLYSYRVFGCVGSTSDDIIIDALLRGYKDDMDIITLSLGGPNGWSETASSVVASRIAKSGKIVTLAAGNEGEYGAWYTGAPATAIDAISVASVDNTMRTLQTAVVHNATHAPIPYNQLAPLPINGTRHVYATSNSSSTPDDACTPLPAGTPDLAAFVVLIRRGTCTFADKFANAAKKGARYFLVYDNVEGYSPVNFGNTTASLISAEDGAFLSGEIAAGHLVSLSFPQIGGAVSLPNPGGGLVSSFSSIGPSYEMFFKPAVAAPGGNIVSTYPVKLGAYAALSGTSMATPFLAGVSALLFQAKGKSAYVGLGARSLFESTAQPIVSNVTAGSPLATLAQAGAGLVDAYAAIHATTLVSPGEFLLNDTANFKAEHELTIKNTCDKTVDYTLSHEPAGTALTVDGLFAVPYPVPLVDAPASVQFSVPSFTLGPGESRSVSVRFASPAGLDPAVFPVYSGFVRVAGAHGETRRVPYLGTAASLRDKQVLDNSATYLGVQLPAILNATDGVQEGPHNYTFEGSDAPSLLLRLAFGSAALSGDLVSKGTTLNATAGGVKALGVLTSFEYAPRNTNAPDEANNGYTKIPLVKTFENGTAIPPGQYRIVVRALRVTGDPQKASDYESWLSPIIGVL